MKDITIVPYQDLSDPSLRSDELARCFCSAFGREDVGATKEMIQTELLEGHRYLVALAEGRIVGLVSWRLWGEPKRHRLVELFHIGVDPESGTRGIGRKLVAAMEEAAHAYFRELGLPGARKVFMLTHADNTRAHSLYRRCGYRLEVSLAEFFREGVDECIFTKEFQENRL